MMDIQACFTDLARRFTTDEDKVQELWAEIQQAYTSRKRHYHSLAHLEKMLAVLVPQQTKLADWDAVLFALFYHDVVYNVLRSDNEEQSAELATKRLAHLGVPEVQVKRCCQHILATKRHESTGDADSDLFTDADLVILGQPWPAYQEYTRQVRAEYRVFPDLLYKPGRRKVLQHFLSQPRIYHTSAFFEQYEGAARANLALEIEEL